MEPGTGGPAVSIITAAYNRSNVLAYALQSALWQTCEDWELIVVDDASTDDTPQLVASFSDARIRYIRLDENIGEQSGPNNIGFEHARGRYIAYLNQDDLWFPDHLERLLTAVKETGSDWVCAPGFATADHGDLKLCGVMPKDRFTPEYARVIFATLWLVKREVFKMVGPWRFYRTIRITPSQDLMLRAWRRGVDIRTTTCPSAMIIHSASRRGSYSLRLDEDNRRYFNDIRSNPVLRDELMNAVCLSNEKQAIEESLLLAPALFRLAATLLKRIGLFFGVMPANFNAALHGKRKGSIVDAFRANRGLPKHVRRKV